MGFALPPTALAAGYRLEAHDSVGSTNALALERAGAEQADRLWVVSKRQETGRGRRGRAWATEEGNLAASLLLVDPSPIASAATLGFVAGLSLADALQAVAPKARLGMAPDGGSAGAGRFVLKWPNDVLADGGKLAGILLESAMLPDGRQAVVIGIGVNVVSHPEDLPYPAVSLAGLGAGCDAATLFLALSDAWLANFSLWNGGNGLAVIRGRWLQHAAGLGSEIAVQVDGRAVRGRFETIDDACRLVIRQDDGTRVEIAAGDVHFGAVASAGSAL